MKKKKEAQPSRGLPRAPRPDTAKRQLNKAYKALDPYKAILATFFACSPLNEREL